MSNAARLLLLSLVTSAVVHAVAGITLAPLLFFTAAVSYPIMVVVVALLVVPLHIYFRRRGLSSRGQLPWVISCGLLCGFIIYCSLAAPNLAEFGAFSIELAIGYSAIGLFAALICWGFYNWGPLRPQPR